MEAGAVMRETELLYATDAYLKRFRSEIVAISGAGDAVALAATAFFPTGGGQPHDIGVLWVGDAEREVVEVVKGPDGVVWHRLDRPAAAKPGSSAEGVIDWERRYLLMRTHTALHVLNGVIWLDHGARVTGAHMTPGEGRLDFELPALSQAFARSIESRVNEKISLDLPVEVRFLPRWEADQDPSLTRLKASLIPREVDPLRVIDIVGLDRQADGGTHVASTGEIGPIRVVKTESKGRENKRVRIALTG